MGRAFLFITLVMISASIVVGETGGQAQEDPRLTFILESIKSTLPEGKMILQTVLKMKPEINRKRASKSLEDIVKVYAEDKGEYNIKPIGWQASQKISGRWKILFYYEQQGEYHEAEWEYNEHAGKLYPFEPRNAPQFWTTERERLPHQIEIEEYPYQRLHYSREPKLVGCIRC